MKFSRVLGILLVVSFFGAILGYQLSKQRPSAPQPDSGAHASGGEAAPSGPVLPPRESPEASFPVPELSFPEGAIKGELIVQLNSREDYEALLKALAEAGERPLGQIDALWAIRLQQGVLAKVDLSDYALRPSYVYRIAQPPPPERIAPEALASLRAYGTFARAITSGPIGGTGEGMRVAVLDSGVADHPFFDAIDVERLDLADGPVGGSGASHGTSVASIISGREGIAPQTELLSIRVLDGEGAGNSFDVAGGIIRAVDQGARIINMSLGVYEDAPILRQAVRYAHDQGVLLVAAAGNDGYDRMPFPAAYEEVIAVTAVDAAGQQARFPNQSTSIDFAAPGVGVLAAGDDAGTLLFSGTSAAAPFVSGSLASLLSGDNPPTPQAAVQLLSAYLNEQGAPGVDPIYGAGVLDWDRLRERDVPELLDVALADIFLPQDSLPGTSAQVEVTVQNRGTRWLSSAELDVQIGTAEPTRFTLGSLSPGQSTTRKVVVSIPSRESEAALQLQAIVKPKQVHDDIRLENNLKAVTFRPSF